MWTSTAMDTYHDPADASLPAIGELLLALGEYLVGGSQCCIRRTFCSGLSAGPVTSRTLGTKEKCVTFKVRAVRIMLLDSANCDERLEHALYTLFEIIESFGSEGLHPVDLVLGTG